jgi:hypothetical protein
LELHEDAEGIVVQVFRPGAGLAATHVASAFRTDDGGGHFEADLPINAAATVVVACRVVGQHGDLVAEEVGSLGPRVRQQRLGLGELQPQLFPHERADLLLDRLGFDARSVEPEQEVSSRGESHPSALAERGMHLSAHPAPIVQPSGRTPSFQ